MEFEDFPDAREWCPLFARMMADFDLCAKLDAERRNNATMDDFLTEQAKTRCGDEFCTSPCD